METLFQKIQLVKEALQMQEQIPSVDNPAIFTMTPVITGDDRKELITAYKTMLLQYVAA